MQPSVSILKETRDEDQRVILLPPGVRRFAEAGFKIYVEKNAGLGAGASDGDYAAAGAEVVSTEDAWTASPFILKWKRPGKHEFRYLQRPMHIGAHFYPGESYDLVQHMRAHGITAYSYEYFQADDGSFPLMVPDSEISGKLAVLFGAGQLLSIRGGRGILLASMPGVQPPRVVVIGHGNAGGAAARTAAALGNDVVVFGHRPESLRRFRSTVPPSVRCLMATPAALEKEIPDADLVIGTILISTYDTPPMVSEALVSRMKPGSVIIDVTCGYGAGYLPTARLETRRGAAAYEVNGVWHYKDPVMPLQVHRTSAQAATVNHAPYLLNLGRAVFEAGFRDPVSERARFLNAGRIEHPHVISDFALIEAAMQKTG